MTELRLIVSGVQELMPQLDPEVRRRLEVLQSWKQASQ